MIPHLNTADDIALIDRLRADASQGRSLTRLPTTARTLRNAIYPEAALFSSPQELTLTLQSPARSSVMTLMDSHTFSTKRQARVSDNLFPHLRAMLNRVVVESLMQREATLECPEGVPFLKLTIFFCDRGVGTAVEPTNYTLQTYLSSDLTSAGLLDLRVNHSQPFPACARPQARMLHEAAILRQGTEACPLLEVYLPFPEWEL